MSTNGNLIEEVGTHLLCSQIIGDLRGDGDASKAYGSRDRGRAEEG